jgi:hypothetical protein
MKRLIIVALFLAPLAQAKDRPYSEKGMLLSMEAVPCGYEENKGNGVAGELLGADSEHKKTQEMLCQEYVLQSDRILYRIRAKDQKHPRLLPVGEEVEFRIQNDKLLLRVPEMDSKEREFLVVSMTPRPDAKGGKPAANRSTPK